MNPDSTALLEIHGLTAEYDGVIILEKVDLLLPAATLICLSGRNGAGKTTLLRAIANTIVRHCAYYSIGGARAGHLPTYKLVRLGLRFVTDDRGVFGGMTVEDNLRIAITTANVRDIDTMSIERFPQISRRLRVRAEALSGGEQRLLSFLCAYLSRPRLMLIDELSEGLDPKVFAEVASLLERGRNDWGMSVLIVDQAPERLSSSLNGIWTLKDSSIQFRSRADVSNRMASPMVNHFIKSS